MAPIQGTLALAGFSFSRYLAGHIVKADNFSGSAKQHECLRSAKSFARSAPQTR
jgi:hypothetical protein